MNWDAVQNDAKAKGHLVFAMSQNQTAVMTQPGPWGSSFDGYCIGLCANWVALQYEGKNFPVAADKTCDNPPWKSTQAQNLSDMSRSADWTGWWKEAMSPFNCSLSDGLRASRETKPTADFLWSIMAQAYGCYGVFLGRDGGAHAIALRHGRDNRYHLFDPNYFHIALKDKTTFKSYVTSYLSQSNYETRYTKRTGVVGIRPPI